ncbi:hypothetical protein Lal_00041955 [Lupinus albus]|nr:hypothetical protein Lal_00041955 [Lupinus albus]
MNNFGNRRYDQSIVPDNIPEQDNNEVLPQVYVQQIQQPQKVEVSLRRFTGERRSAIPDDYTLSTK